MIPPNKLPPRIYMMNKIAKKIRKALMIISASMPPQTEKILPIIINTNPSATKHPIPKRTFHPLIKTKKNAKTNRAIIIASSSPCTL